ncbi:MAG: hypothetical protein HYS27_23680 [Deltaproteobacteria bacterium]|nr:hypothetical protein [Deltaproteobacteria bacterium]
MLASVCLALALAPQPKIAVVVLDGPTTVRAELVDALAADGAVSAQPQSLVDQLLANAATMGLVCTIDDLPCWIKIGLDGELDQLVVAGTGASGAFELRLVDVGTGHDAGHVTVAPGAPLDARAAIASLLHPAPAPTVLPPAERAVDEPRTATPAAEPRPVPAPPAPATSPMLMIAAGGAAVVSVACGIGAATVDVGLTEMLVSARDTGVRLDLESYREQETTQNLLIVCGAVAGATAIAGAAGALVVE